MAIFSRRFPPWRSLFVKMTAGTAVLLVLVVGAAFYYALQIEMKLEMEDTERFTRHLSEMVLQSFDTLAEGNQPYHTKYLASKLLALPQLEDLRVVAIDGTIQFARNNNEVGTPLKLSERASCRDCHTKEGQATGERVYRGANGKLTYHLPVAIPNGPRCLRCHKAEYKILGTLITEVEIENIERKMNTFKLSILSSFSLACLLALFGSIVLFRRLIARPFRTMMNEMRRIEEGDFSLGPVPKSRDELQELYETFHTMTMKLAAAQAQLNESLTQKSNRVEDLDRELRRIYSNLITMEHLSAIGTLSAQVVHEVRTPLNVLSLNLQLLERQLLRSPEQAEDTTKLVKAIGNEVERIAKILERFLDRAKRPPSSHVSERLNELVSGVVALLDIEAQKAQVLFALDLPSHSESQLLPADELRQILINLIANAIHAMPQGGTIAIKAREENGFVRLVVRDTGPGIAPELQEAVFTPFYTTRQNGTGLGLAIVKRLVEELGGKITLTSAVGAGAEFAVLLPLGRSSLGAEAAKS